MIAVADLDTISRARVDDAKILLAAKRFDGAVYMCGYAIEIALKARVCRTLGWNEFPMTQNEFKGLTNFKTHDLDLLLRLSGVEANIKQIHFLVWNAVAVWNPEAR
ncbi:MAG: HEPN domain-containing protein [Gemmatimonadaceae bacterium]|nr:HEPN domain-containing protein [Gemmatimonadaceae bacterium]MBA3557368.1 HEPN domain-containing protein [Gemmatimonadaceae bacterium]